MKGKRRDWAKWGLGVYFVLAVGSRAIHASQWED